jgi:predicted transcriptional regulator
MGGRLMPKSLAGSSRNTHKLTSTDIKKAKAMLLDPNMTKAEIANHFNVSRPTLNKWLKS